jgi:signal transduction histidine kinase
MTGATIDAMGQDDGAVRPAAGPRIPGTARGSTIRAVLFSGFAAIFALWLVSAYDLVQRVTDADERAAGLMARFTEGEELLFTVRAQVFLSSVYARDAVLDTEPGAMGAYRQSLEAMRSEVDGALRRYTPNVDSEIEAEHWARLQAELREYWDSLSPLLARGVTGDPADAHAFLRREVIPKREVIVRISDDIRTLNQDALHEQQAAVAALHRTLRQRIWWTSGTAVALGLAAAWLAAHHAGRLESRIRQQHVQEQQAKQELQRLSGELVHAQERERRTIARDLHDEIGQALMTVKLDLGTVERSGQVSGAPAQALAEARATTELAIRTVRDLSQLLHPPMLDDFGLVVTLEAFVRRFGDRTGVQTELALDGMDRRFSSDVEVCVYRVVQEALTNVARHAEAASCRVTLQRRADSLLVTIEDDGNGIEPARVARSDGAGGVGLVGIRERASRLGGTVRLETGPGRGTRLTIEIPTPAADRLADIAGEAERASLAQERV